MNTDPWNQPLPDVPEVDRVGLDGTLRFSRQTWRKDRPTLCHRCREVMPSAEVDAHAWNRHAAGAHEVLDESQHGWKDAGQGPYTLLGRLRARLRPSNPYA